MKKQDKLLTAISKNNRVNCYICDVTQTVREIQKKQNLNIISSAILSRAVAATVLLSGNLKNSSDLLTVQWKCSGPVKSMVIEANYEGEVRAFIGENQLSYIDNTRNDNGLSSNLYIEVGEIIVSRKTFDNRSPYFSVTPIENGEIAEDISIYLKNSLQIESAINLALSIDKNNFIETCGGLLLMALPGALDKEIDDIKEVFFSIESLTSLFKENFDDINLINKKFDKLKLNVLSSKNIKFKCRCNRESIFNFIKGLPQDDFISLITDDGLIHATCQFCGMEYRFAPKQFEIKAD